MSRAKLMAALPTSTLAVFAIAYVWIAYDYDLASRSMPWIAGVLAIALALIDIVVTGNDAVPQTQGEATAAPPSPWQEIVAFAWIGAFLPLVVVLGFYGATPLYIFCYLRLYAGKNALVSAATAFGVMGCLYLVFEGLMGYAIFAGLLGGDTL
jgi:hypothetical protein